MYTDAGVTGNVGIGTTVPQSHLHIDNLLDATESGASNLALLLRHKTITAGGGPGIGFSSDNTPSVGAKIVHIRTSSNSMGDLAFYTKPSTSGPTTEKMRIKDNGNVGIGTRAPTTKLDVAGTVNATAFTGDGSALTGIAGDSDWTISGSDMYTGAGVTGNVGIGTTSPQNKLDVAGRTTMRTDTADSTKVLIFDNLLGAMRIYTDSSAGTAKDLILGTYPNGHTNQLFLQQSTGNVGIGTTSPQGKLDVNGTIFQSGSVLHADYVFEDSYELESIEEHSEFMWRNKHLAAIPKATVDAQGREIVEIGSHRKGIVEELEKAHIYIEQLDNKNKTLEQRVEKLENVISKLLGNKKGVL